MTLFLEVVPVDEAIACARRIAPAMPVETVPLGEAWGRVLGGDAVADADIPGFTRSVVDGFAVVAADTVGAGEALPAMLAPVGRVAMGSDAALRVRPGECAYVPTGGVLPRGADAMAMVEYSEEIADAVLVYRPVAPGENIILAGEDFAAGERSHGAPVSASSRPATNWCR
jgi:molybdopterin molybdotransferase